MNCLQRRIRIGNTGSRPVQRTASADELPAIEFIAADVEELLYNAVWKHFPRSIRVFLDNKNVFQPFWDYRNGRISEDEWQSKFYFSKRAATRALGRMDTVKVITILFERLYVLRNQLVHCGST